MEVPQANYTREEKVLLASDGSAGYGGGEYEIEILDRKTAPKKKKYKWNYLWGELRPDLMNRIQMDEVATFSVTDMNTAEHISKELLNLEDINEFSVITDATACVGGNAICFARYFRRVNAIELDDARCRMLKNNFDVCLENQSLLSMCKGCQMLSFCCVCEDTPARKLPSKSAIRPIIGSMSIMQGDCLNLCQTLKQDILFLDPPWGGKKYSERDAVPLYLSGCPLHKVCAKLGKLCRYLTVKLPFNADLTQTLDDPNCKLVKRITFEKMLLVILEYSKALDEKELSFLMGIGLKLK